MLGRLTLPDHGLVFLNEGATRSELDLRKMEALRLSEGIADMHRRSDRYLAEEILAERA